MLKMTRHRERDRERVSYLLNFPTDLKHDQVVAWLRAISRTVTTSKLNLAGSQSIVFEMLATDHGITHRLRVPWQHQDDIIPQLRALVPGVSATPEEHRLSIEWTEVIEAGESNKNRPLDIPHPEHLVASILAGAHPLNEGEAVILQWVIAPARPERLPDSASKSSDFSLAGVRLASADEVKERRQKLSEPNMMAVLRIAARADSESRAKHLIGRIRTSLRATESYANQWTLSRNSQDTLKDRVQRAASMVIWPAQLTVSELAALIAWPIGAPNVSGLPRGAARQLPTPHIVPTEGLVIGHSNFAGQRRAIAIDFESSCKHVWITAPTGTGKTVLMSNMSQQVMDAGLGMMLIETKRDLFESTLDLVPKHRINDVIVLDVHDTIYPVGLNLLDGAKPEEVIDDLESIVANIHGEERSIWLKEVIYHGMRTLMSRPGATVADLSAILSPRFDEVDWRDELLRNTTDPELLHFWQRLENQGKARQDQIVAPVLSRFWHFNSRPAVRNVFAQRESTFSITEAVNNNKIIAVNLTGLDKDATKIIGSMLVNSLWKTVLAHRRDRPFYLMADEAQNLMHIPVGMGEMLAQARSLKLAIIMANQYPTQIPDAIRQSAESNARTKISFQLEQKDARYMAPQFAPMLSEHDLRNLQAYEGAARIATAEGVSPPLTFSALAPPRSRGNALAVRSASRRQYGRPVADVEAQVSSWRKPQETAPKRQRPKISGDGW